MIPVLTPTLNAVSAESAETKTQLKTITAVDNQSRLNIPVDWMPMTTINKNAEILAGNEMTLTCVIVLTGDACRHTERRRLFLGPPPCPRESLR